MIKEENQSRVANNRDITTISKSTTKSKNMQLKTGNRKPVSQCSEVKIININLATYCRSIQEELVKLKEDATCFLGISLFIQV